MYIVLFLKVNAVNHRIAYPDEIFDDEYLNNFYADVSKRINDTSTAIFSLNYNIGMH